jgi:glycosyltransferase involved in cell wall biosynthesis
VKCIAIVPAFNEQGAIGGVVDEILAFNPAYDVIVIDDASADRTSEEARSHGAIVVRLPFNLGIGGAVQSGFTYALENGYDRLAQIDGDGQHDPAYIEGAILPIAEGRADLVIGSRFLAEGGFRSTFLRRAGIRYLSGFLRLRCGARTTDPTSGFRAAGRKAIELFSGWYPSDYPEPEAIAFATRNHLRLLEVPVRMKERLHGRSTINLWRSFYYLVKVSFALVLLPTRPDLLSLNAPPSERAG